MMIYFALCSLEDNNRQIPFYTKTTKLKILAVDDNHEFLESLKFNIQNEYQNIEITTVSSGENAIDCIRDNGFHLILLDLVMPGMDGADVLKQIKKIDRKYFVIIMTAHANDKLMQIVKKENPDGILHKPFSLKELNKYFPKNFRG